MKTRYKFVLLITTFLCLQCSKSEKIQPNTTPTAALLAQKKQTILDYINSFQCSATSGCSSIAFGEKPCGGPWEYLVYSNNVNAAQLQQMVSEYNVLNLEFNTISGAGSDCMFVNKPTNIGCANGKCGIIN